MSNMEGTTKKEIQKRELADVFINAFLSPQNATLAFISALQERQVPNVADLFNSEQIGAAATITKKVSFLINLQMFALICAFRFWRISSAKRKRNAPSKSKSASAFFNLHSMALSFSSHTAISAQTMRSRKVGAELRQAKKGVEVVFMFSLILAHRLVAGAPKKMGFNGR